MKPSTQFEFWLDKTDKELEKIHMSSYPSLSWKPLTYTKGRKFIKILRDRSVWGFVCMFDGFHKNAQVKVGDLMLPANYRTPAKHARGNIFDGTAFYSMYGPSYLK